MRSLFTNILLVGFTAALSTGCLTSKKVDRQVAKQYTDIPAIKKQKPGDNISITSPLISADQQISKTETKTSNMLPLLFYWKWDYTNTCTLNYKIPVNNFTTTVNNYASRGLRTKLTGENLELSIEKIPNKFQILDKAHLIFFGYAVGWDDVSTSTVDMQMIVSYRVLKNNVEIKKGIISIPGVNDKKQLGMFKNWKTATSEYLTQFDDNIVAMTKLFVDNLVSEL